MSLESAFNFIISVQGHECSINKSDGSLSVSLKMCKTNRFRQMNFIEDSVHDGNEMLVSERDLSNLSFGVPKRGDYISSTLLGEMSISAVEEQIVMGKVIGYRLRCD